MEYSIPSIEEYEKETETEEIEVDSVKRWSVANLDKIQISLKNPKQERIPKWKPSKPYWRPVVTLSPGVEKSGLIGFLLKSILDEANILGYSGDPEDKNFVPISQETLSRAKQFLLPYLVAIPMPNYTVEILPGPEGSVDIHWKNPKKELLINIPPDEKEPALFYGDNYGKLSIEGKINTNFLDPTVLMWLIDS